MIDLRLAKIDELNLIMDIIKMAKVHLKEQGIDQWQSEYPSFSDIEKDINTDKGYVVYKNNEIYGYLCIDFDGEEAYNEIDGEWNTDEDYVVVHRLAFSSNARGKGISHRVFSLTEDICRKKGVKSFRVDTNKRNKKMQHILEKNGFKYTGEVKYISYSRMAYDKIID